MPTPRFKVIDPTGEYVASCADAQAAAALAALYGKGTVVRDKRVCVVVWHEGREEQPAGESYDWAARLMWQRINDAHDRALLRMANRYGAVPARRGSE
jgi:hypothetical protein